MITINDLGKIKCTCCGETITIENASIHNRKKGSYRPICKECKKIRDLEYQEKRVATQKAITKERKKEGCCCCGDKRHYVLDFHHVDPKTKVERVSHMIGRYSTDSIIKEMDKCVLLCSNCHRKFHQYEISDNLTLSDFLKMEAI